MKKTSIFIDAEYLLQSLRRIKNKPKGLSINKNCFNWGNFIKYIAVGYDIVNIYYYTARLNEDENSQTYNEQTLYLDSVRNKLNSYNVLFRIGKMIKTRMKSKGTWNEDRYSRGDEKITWVQKGVDTKIVLDMCTIKECTPDVESVILVSGDSDFCELLKYLNARKVETVLVTFDRFGSRLQNDLLNCAQRNIKIGYIEMSENEIIK